MNNLGLIRVKGIALAVADLDRANRFYGETLALPPDTIRNMESAYLIGDAGGHCLRPSDFLRWHSDWSFPRQ